MPWAMVLPGETAADPDGLRREPFPVPLQAVALVLDQESVDDRPFGIEVGGGEEVTVGDVCA